MVYYFDGERARYDDALLPDPLVKEGLIIKLKEYDFDYIRLLMDTSGSSAKNEIPLEFEAIIDEEMCSFTLGCLSVEDCVKHIEERISLVMNKSY